MEKAKHATPHKNTKRTIVVNYGKSRMQLLYDDHKSAVC